MSDARNQTQDLHMLGYYYLLIIDGVLFASLQGILGFIAGELNFHNANVDQNWGHVPS